MGLPQNAKNWRLATLPRQMAPSGLWYVQKPYVGTNWQLAMARKNGVVDVILAPSSDLSSGTDTEDSGAPHGARLLCTIRENRMRLGVERWVGLRITDEYVTH